MIGIGNDPCASAETDVVRKYYKSEKAQKAFLFR